jgi:hypothetical protein
MVGLIGYLRDKNKFELGDGFFPIGKTDERKIL